MTEKSNERIKEKKELSKEEFIQLIPNLSLDELILTEYEVDSKWKQLIQLKDSSKRLFQCCLCNVAQFGPKNLYAHLGGKKHNLKIKSVKQLYHAKYHSKKYKTSESNSYKTNDIKPDIAKSCHLYENILFENTKKGACGIKDGNSLRTEDLYSNCDRDEPPLKKPKMVLNPAAISKQRTKEVSKKTNSCNETPKCLSTLRISAAYNKNSCNTVTQPVASVNQEFSTKTFNHSPVTNDVLGLIGVEYIVKILNTSSGGEPRYECSLCEFINNALGMQGHLLDYNHRLKFCEKHFPTALRQYKQYIRNVKPSEIYKVMTPILKKLAVAIEYHHGRELPYECTENEYNTNRHEIFSKVFSCRHASEQYGPTFTHIVNSKEVDKFIQEIDEYKSPNFANNITFDLRVNITSHGSLRNIKTTHQERHSSYTKSHIDIMPRTKYYKDPLHGCNFSTDQKLTLSLHKNDISQTYIQIVEKQLMDLSETFQIYRTDPESHPAYNEEWQVFWRRRKNELIEGGLDHRTYNYQPEWVRYFNNRIEELFNQALKDIRMNARNMLGLSMTHKQLSHDDIYHESVDDEKIKTNLSTDKYPITNQNLEIYDYNKQNQIVSLIRLLASLEKYLGSLGPKVNQLLFEALDAERNYPGQLNSMILTEQNCSILETAMEKFKGLIIADVIDCAEKRSLRAAIGGLETVLSYNKNILHHSHPTMYCAHDINILPEPFLATNTTKNSGNHNNLLQLDKKELSLKLANLLTAQGKTDIDPSQLQRILSVYMMIEKKKNLTEMQPQN